MADVKNLVSLHLVWATYDLLPKLTPEVAKVAYECIRSVGDRLHCPVIAIGGVEDHVHVLVQFSTTATIANMVQEMKGYSTRVINERFPELYFKWQGGYGVFPITPSIKNQVVNYIARQEEHHNNKTLIANLEDSGFQPVGKAAVRKPSGTT
jgi:putative transposase